MVYKKAVGIFKKSKVSLIGRNSSAEGDMSIEGGIRIFGKMKGKSLSSKDTIYIGKGAKVEASLNSKYIEIEGEVIGNVNADELKILSTGKVYGNVKASSIYVEKSAFVKGEFDMEISKGSLNKKDGHSKNLGMD